jgi:TRAP transporter 4TM/12TM fusion protein
MSKDKKTHDLSELLSEEQLAHLKNLETEEDIEVSNHRKIKGTLGIVIFAWAVLTSAAHIYFLVFNPIDTYLFRSLHVVSLGVLGFLLVPGWSKAKEKIHFLDWAGIAASIGIFIYFYMYFEQIIWRIRVRPADTDVLMAVIGVIIIIELARRTSGNALLFLAGTFLAYGLLGKNLPGILGHSGYAFKRFMGYIYSDYGVFSAPIAISSRYIVLFIIFASFLTTSGVGRYFVEWAFSVSGHARGGPAKVAVIASALMGTMNGTSAGNAVATGSLTIPLMKKVGYSPTFAAATEAVASTGGQVMPPIMGAGIFIMAEITNIPYQRIMLAGIIPAFLYFSSCFMMVDYEAVKLNLLGFPRHALPNFWQTMKRGYLFIPVILLFYFLMTGWSVIMAGFIGITSSFVVSWLNALINRKLELGMGVSKVLKALEGGARGSIQLMAVCAAAGIVMGVVALTGVGVKFANLLLGIAGTSQLLALIFAMGVCILLGMGMPTTAAYAIAASVLAPGLIRMGLPVIVAHMFVFYYACVSAITPPVALAAYAASGISGSDPMRTGYMSFRLGITAYIVPFMFYYAPSIILGNQTDAMLVLTTLADGSQVVLPLAIGTVILRTVTALIGVWALASSVQGWYFGRAKLWQQAVLFVASLFLVTPSEIFDGLGLVILVLIALVQIQKRKREDLAPAV